MAAGMQNKKDATIEKQNIFFTRDYRHLPKPRFSMWFFVVLLVLPSLAAILVFYPQVSRGVSEWVSGVITNNTGVSTSVISSEFIPMIGPVYLVDIAGTLPTRVFSIINLAVSLLVLILAGIFRKSGFRSFIIFLCMAMFIHMISSLVFIFFPEYFPYTLKNYSELYMEQQIAIWLCISAISGFAISLIFSSLISKLITYLATLAYTFVYGVVRYVIYLVILHFFSSLYMATLFFTLGVLFDFLQMVFIYILYVQYASKAFGSQKEGALWKWS
jgi:hypothetical protein